MFHNSSDLLSDHLNGRLVLQAQFDECQCNQYRSTTQSRHTMYGNTCLGILLVSARRRRNENVLVSCGQKRNNKVTKYLSFFSHIAY